MTTLAAETAMTERQLKEAVVECSQRLGYVVYWTWNSIHSPAGFPDLCLVRECVIFAELKTTKGELTLNQEHWRDRLQAANVAWFLWRPADWLDGSIERVLRDAAPKGEG